MFYGNITNPPPVASDTCAIHPFQVSAPTYNLTTTNTYITVSHSGSPRGPWTEPILVKGMENDPTGKDPWRWSCASGNPSPAFHPNGTLFAAMRHDPCWKEKPAGRMGERIGYFGLSHIGLWRADMGWNSTWVLVSKEPIYGWGNGSQQSCSDDNGCPSHEDPHLWIDSKGGFHLLTHDQNDPEVQAGFTHEVRGAYGWSLDGINWNLETDPIGSNASAWEIDL